MPDQPGAPCPSQPQVLCFGEALVDRLAPATAAPDAAAPAQAEGADPAGVVAGSDHLGGAPANVACALGRLGTPVAFVGRLGDDAIGTAFMAMFKERGVETCALQWDAERPSRIVLVQRDATGERSFAGFSGDRGLGFADQAIDAEALAGGVAPLLDAAQWLLVGTIPLATAASAAALEMVVALAAERGIPLAVDVNWRPTFWGLGPQDTPPPQVGRRIRALLERAALIKCAAEEAEDFFGSVDPLALQAALPQRPAVLISDGARPLRWCLGVHRGTMEAFAVEVVDTTGAGDAFTAGVLHGLCRRPELLQGDASEAGAAADPGAVPDLLRFASACGALVCGGSGAIDPQPTAEQVEAFLRQQPRECSISH